MKLTKQQIANVLNNISYNIEYNRTDEDKTEKKSPLRRRLSDYYGKDGSKYVSKQLKDYEIAILNHNTKDLELNPDSAMQSMFVDVDCVFKFKKEKEYQNLLSVMFLEIPQRITKLGRFYIQTKLQTLLSVLDNNEKYYVYDNIKPNKENEILLPVKIEIQFSTECK